MESLEDDDIYILFQNEKERGFETSFCLRYADYAENR